MLNDLNSQALHLPQRPMHLRQCVIDLPQRAMEAPQRALDLPQDALDLPSASAAPAAARTRLVTAQGVHRKLLIQGQLATTTEALRLVAAAVHHYRCGGAPLPLTQVWRTRR